jgi:hypothetical protein
MGAKLVEPTILKEKYPCITAITILRDERLEHQR